MDNSVDVFFNKESNNYIDFQEWKEQFGSDQVIVIAFNDKDIFTYENLNLISRLTQRFESLQDIHKVTSLTNANDVVGQDQDFIVEKFVEHVPDGLQELQALKSRALSNPLFLKNVISTNGAATAITLELVHRAAGTTDIKKR